MQWPGTRAGPQPEDELAGIPDEHGDLIVAADFFTLRWCVYRTAMFRRLHPLHVSRDERRRLILFLQALLAGSISAGRPAPAKLIAH